MWVDAYWKTADAQYVLRRGNERPPANATLVYCVRAGKPEERFGVAEWTLMRDEQGRVAEHPTAAEARRRIPYWEAKVRGADTAEALEIADGRPIVLDWQPPQHHSRLDRKRSPLFGVIYIWGFRFENDQPLLPYYVGLTARAGADRMAEHRDGLQNGLYRIWHRDHLACFFCHFGAGYVYEDHSLVVYSGPLKGQDTAANRQRCQTDFAQRRAEIRPHLEYMLEHLYFTYAKPAGTLASLEAIEKKVMRAIGVRRLINHPGGRNPGDGAPQCPLDNRGAWSTLLLHGMLKPCPSASLSRPTP